MSFVLDSRTRWNSMLAFYISDVALEFMLDELTKQNSFLSIQLYNTLILRIQERRSVCVLFV